MQVVIHKRKKLEKGMLDYLLKYLQYVIYLIWGTGCYYWILVVRDVTISGSWKNAIFLFVYAIFLFVCLTDIAKLP